MGERGGQGSSRARPEIAVETVEGVDDLAVIEELEPDDLDLVAESALAHRSLRRLRMFGLAFALVAVLATIWMPQPEDIDRGVSILLVGVTVVTVLLMLHPRLTEYWPWFGPVATVLLVAALVASSGGALSVYTPLYLLLVVMNALTQPWRRLLLVVVLVAVALLAPVLYSDVTDEARTRLVVDLIVWSGIVVLVHRQADALRTRQERLEAEVHRQQQTAAALRRAEQVRGTILRNLTHELRTPLTVMVGSVSMLRDADQGEIELHVLARSRLIHSLSRSVDRLEVLLSDVMRIDRYATACEPATTATCMGTRLSELIELVDLAPRRVRLSLEPTPVAVDPDGLDRALIHLLDNVLRHTPADPELEVHITVGIDEDDDARLVIEDTGDGFPEGDVRDLLQPFVQGEDAERRPDPGTGLGLTLVDRFATSYGGRVELGSRDDGRRGAHVTLVLPRSEISMLGTGSGDADTTEGRT